MHCILCLGGDFSVSHLPHLPTCSLLTSSLQSGVSSWLHLPYLRLPTPIPHSSTLFPLSSQTSLTLSYQSSHLHPPLLMSPPLHPPCPVSPWPCLLPATPFPLPLSGRCQFPCLWSLPYNDSSASSLSIPPDSPSWAFKIHFSLRPHFLCAVSVPRQLAVRCLSPTHPQEPLQENLLHKQTTAGLHFLILRQFVKQVQNKQADWISFASIGKLTKKNLGYKGINAKPVVR